MWYSDIERTWIKKKKKYCPKAAGMKRDNFQKVMVKWHKDGDKNSQNKMVKGHEDGNKNSKHRMVKRREDPIWWVRENVWTANILSNWAVNCLYPELIVLLVELLCQTKMNIYISCVFFFLLVGGWDVKIQEHTLCWSLSFPPDLNVLWLCQIGPFWALNESVGYSQSKCNHRYRVFCSIKWLKKNRASAYWWVFTGSVF